MLNRRYSGLRFKVFIYNTGQLSSLSFSANINDLFSQGLEHIHSSKTSTRMNEI